MLRSWSFWKIEPTSSLKSAFLGLPLKDTFVLKVTGLAIQNVVDNSTFDVGFVSLMVERDNGTVFHHYQTDQAIVDGKIVYERSRRL